MGIDSGIDDECLQSDDIWMAGKILALKVVIVKGREGAKQLTYSELPYSGETKVPKILH